MRSLAILPLLCIACTLVQLVQGYCDLSLAKRDVEFPDIEKAGIESYQMSVEYTLPNLQQTNYYTEYYDLVGRRGRIDAHQAGKNSSYIYMTQTREAWEVSNQTCMLINITDIPEMMKYDMTDWFYITDDDEKRTFGPSAMFKIARDAWKIAGYREMAYIGEIEFSIRGHNAQYWRRCVNDKSYVDYYFTTNKEKDPLGTGLKNIPLRVYFGGMRAGMGEEMSTQQYEIITLQPFITRDKDPFQLPKGCRRGYWKLSNWWDVIPTLIN